MPHVTSADGTPIAYDRAGSGPALILVGGGLTDRAENAPLVPALAERFTVYNYDRRGRGESGDTPPYAVAREIEDLGALVAEIGAPAHVYGVSSGGALALEAAAAGTAFAKVAVYEVPYNVADDWPGRWRTYVEELQALLADGRRGEALARFMRLADVPDEVIAGSRGSPMRTQSEALAHTLAYDAACLGDGRPPVQRLRRITQPTLVAVGAGPGQLGAAGWIRALPDAADAIAASIANAERATFGGQGHVADPRAVAAALQRFFSG